jgi:hypothetical protein
MQLFIDGVNGASLAGGSGSVNMGAATDRFNIGRHRPDKYLNGRIRNVEVYSGAATNGADWVPGDTSSLKTASYSNTGGSGDRTGIITETHNGWGTAQNGGETASDGDTTTIAYNTSTINSSVWIQHDFGSAVSIAEAKYYFNQINNVTTWKFQASNTDGSGYVDVSASFSMNATPKVVAITDLNPYRYWRVVGVSGTMNNWATELEWKVCSELSLIMQSRDGSGTDNEQGLTFTANGDPVITPTVYGESYDVYQISKIVVPLTTYDYNFLKATVNNANRALVEAIEANDDNINSHTMYIDGADLIGDDDIDGSNVINPIKKNKISFALGFRSTNGGIPAVSNIRILYDGALSNNNLDGLKITPVVGSTAVNISKPSNGDISNRIFAYILG